MKRQLSTYSLLATTFFNAVLVGFTICWPNAPIHDYLKFFGLIIWTGCIFLWMRSYALHVQTLGSLLLSVLATGLVLVLGIPASYITNYLAPLGQLMLNNMMVLAMPLMATSLMLSITNLGNTRQLSRMGMTSLILYGLTTLLSIGLGVGLSSVIGPGYRLSDSVQGIVQASRSGSNSDEGGLWFVLMLFPQPTGIGMIPVIVATLALSIGLVRTPVAMRVPLQKVGKGLHGALINVMQLVMHMAPLGTFALVTNLLVSIGTTHGLVALMAIGQALLWYTGTVLLGLGLLNWVFYPVLLYLFTTITYTDFVEATRGPQLLAFSTVSSMATLPLTIERSEKVMGIDPAVSQFVLPLGASINMNGTALYQTIALLFLGQLCGTSFSWGSYAYLIAQVFISSLGAAPVPGGAMASTRLILKELGIPTEMTLLMIPDRLLEMCRTATNITGDVAVTGLIDHWEKVDRSNS